MGGALARTNIYSVMDGPGSDCSMNGLYLLHGTQHIDHQTRIEHAQPNCTSREIYKGVLDGTSHGVFNGKVYVRPDRPEDRRQADQQQPVAVATGPRWTPSPSWRSSPTT